MSDVSVIEIGASSYDIKFGGFPMATTVYSICNVYIPTSGLRTKCTNSEQRVPKSFPVIGRRRKWGKIGSSGKQKTVAF